jgi:hypothetical protein
MNFNLTQEEREAQQEAAWLAKKLIREQLEAENNAVAQQEMKANAVQRQAQINAENDRLLEIYKAYCNSVRYQAVMGFGEWVGQYKQNILSAGW